MRGDTASGPTTDLDRTAAIALAVTIALIPFNEQLTLIVRDTNPGGIDPLIRALRISPLDIMFILMIVIAAAQIFRTRPRWQDLGIVELGLFAGACISTVSAASNLSASSAAASARFWAVAATAYVIAHLEGDLTRRYVVAPYLVVATSQALLALGQTATNSGLIVEATLLSEGHPWTAGHGTFHTPYALAAFLTVAIALSARYESNRNGWRWTPVCALICSAAAATTFGRTSAIGVFMVAGALTVDWCVSGRKRYPVSALAALVPFLVTSIVLSSGWIVRLTDLASGEDRGRMQLLDTAVNLIRTHPLIGVGPGMYAQAVDAAEQFVVHNVPVLLAAELGVVAGLAVTVWLAVLGYHAIMESWRAAALFASVVPYLLFDNLHVVFIAGLALSAVWLGLLGNAPGHSMRAAPSSLDART